MTHFEEIKKKWRKINHNKNKLISILGQIYKTNNVHTNWMIKTVDGRLGGFCGVFFFSKAY
jgi:hypothetical protein